MGMYIYMQFFSIINFQSLKVFFLTAFKRNWSHLLLFIFSGLLLIVFCPCASLFYIFFGYIIFFFILLIFFENKFFWVDLNNFKYQKIEESLTKIFISHKKNWYCSVFPLIFLQEKGLSNLMALEFWKFFDLSDFSVSFFIFFGLFFFKLIVPFFLFQGLNLILFFVFFILVLFNYCFFYTFFAFVGILIYFSFFFSLFLCFFFLSFWFAFIFFCFLLSLLNNLFNMSLIGVSFFSKDFLAIEDEDLWISSNFFYFDHRIVESEQLNVPLKVKDVQVFYTLLQLFFKFPNTFIDSDYIFFSKNFHQTILGHNPSLYNIDSQIIEPYNKNVVRDNSVSAFQSFPQLFDLTVGPFLQFEFTKSDFLFYRKLFKYLFIYKSTSFLRFRRQRRKNYWKKLFKRRKYSKYRVFLDFRAFHGLPEKFNPQTHNLNHPYLKQPKISENVLSLNMTSDKLRLLALRFKPFERKSRLESRFLKFFWISLPIYSSQIHRFFFNFFPSIKSFSFFPSKIKIWFDKFLNLFVLGQKKVVIINTPLSNLTLRGIKRGTFTLASGGSFEYKNKEEEISELVRLSNVEIRGEESIESAKQKLNKTGRTKDESQQIKKKGVSGGLNTGSFYQDVFDVLNVNKSGILDDLRRINELKKSSFLGEKKEGSVQTMQQKSKKKYSKKTAKGSQDLKQETVQGKRERKRTKRKEQNVNIFERYKVYWQRLERKRSRQRKRFENLQDLAGLYEGNSSEHFSIKKRVRYKRYLRRNATRIRAFWISRNRFFFPTQYNRSSDLYIKIELLELYKVLEYFYFVLGNDRDLFEITAFSIVVSSLQNRFGVAIVNDLLSTQDHKQASRVSVVLHVQDEMPNISDKFQIKNQDDNLSGMKANSDSFSSENKFSYNQQQRFTEGTFLHDNSRIFLSSYMFAYLQNLLIYYKYMGSSFKKGL